MSGLFEANHYALEGLLRARIAGLFPGTPALTPPAVGGIVEYARLRAGEAVSLPAVFVLFEGEALEEGTGPHVMRVRQFWSVLLAAPQGEEADMAVAGAYVARLLKGLAGARLADGLRPLVQLAEQEGGAESDGDVLFVSLVFSQGFELR